MIKTVISYGVFIFFVSELLLYFGKYWGGIPLETNNRLTKMLLNYGVKLFSYEIDSKYPKEQIINFVRTYVRPKKIIGDEIFLRRKYLKWIQWATPVPLQCRIVIEERKSSHILLVTIKSIFTPWILIIYTLFWNLTNNQLSLAQSVFISILAVICLYIFALIERAAIVHKIKKIATLDNSYTIFA